MLGSFSLAPPCNPSNKRIVNSVSTVTLGDGFSHRIYQLKPYIADCSGIKPFSDTIIEGVGNDIGVIENVKFYPQINPWQVSVTSVVANCLVINNTTVIYSRGAANCNYPLNINEVKNNLGMELFPNPANSFLIIKNTGGENIKKMTIINSIGQEIFHILSGFENINVSSLTSGMYFLLIEKDNGKSMAKFIRE
jgi:hypothetical protein